MIEKKKKYSKFGLHNGEIGFVIDDVVISGNIEIDFPDLDENNEFYGETFSINIDDLKIVK